MYVKRNAVARSRNHCWSENTTMHSVSVVVGLQVTVNYIKTLSVAQKRFCGKFMSPTTIKRTQVFMQSARCCIETKGKFVCLWPRLDVQFG